MHIGYDWGPVINVLPTDVEFYIKINNVQFNSIKLIITEKNKEVFYPNNEYTLEEIAKDIGQKYNIRQPYFQVQNKGKYGLIDRKGNLKLDFISIDEIVLTENKYIIKKDDNLCYLVNSEGIVVGDGYENMKFDRAGKGAIVSNNGKFGVINIEGNLIVPTKYSNIEILDYEYPNIEIFDCKKDDIFTHYLVNNKGKEIYKTSSAHIFNVEPVLISVEDDNQKYIIDENGIVKMQGIKKIYDGRTDTYYIKILDENAMIYGVNISDLLNDSFTIESITEDKIVLKDEEKIIIIQDGRIID